jgi:hypothetical protein
MPPQPVPRTPSLFAHAPALLTAILLALAATTPVISAGALPAGLGGTSSAGGRWSGAAGTLAPHQPLVAQLIRLDTETQR